jgi:uncharacterized protein YuzE
MRVIYDTRSDTLSILLSDQPIVESDEDKPGVILDYDAGGNLVSVEILDASARVSQPTQMVYELASVTEAGRP